MLPQFYEGGGYYVYGTPASGAGQYAHPKMMTFLLRLAHDWSGTDCRKFGVGNISLAGGGVFRPHHSHRSGLDADFRPVRKDGLQRAVSCASNEYDQEATRRLVELMWGTSTVRTIYFNDGAIEGVRRLGGHDNHLHVSLIAA